MATLAATAIVADISGVGLRVARHQFEVTTRIHRPELVLRGQSPFATPPLSVSHVIFRLLDRTAEWRHHILLIEIVVVAIAMIPRQPVVILCEGRRPGIVVAPCHRVFSAHLCPPVAGRRREGISLSCRLAEVIHRPDDGVSQRHGVSVLIDEGHAVNLQINPIGIGHRRLPLEGDGVEMAGADVERV